MAVINFAVLDGLSKELEISSMEELSIFGRSVASLRRKKNQRIQFLFEIGLSVSIENLIDLNMLGFCFFQYPSCKTDLKPVMPKRIAVHAAEQLNQDSNPRLVDVNH